jgi:UDP-2-acetamido-2,6-beta-L-arabino-hexul-4-ose reductase
MACIGITGAQGMIGWHLRCSYLGVDGIEIRQGGREAFSSTAALENFVAGCDAIVHLAGQNRGDEEKLYQCNVGLAQALVDACISTGSRPHLLFSSSTHIDGETRYGASKRDAAAVLARWAQDHGGRFSNLVLPHVYGEHGKPFYNSVVHTFCHQLALKETPTIDCDGDLHLMHAGSVADFIHKTVTVPTLEPSAEFRPQGVAMKVSQLLARLSEFATLYRDAKLIPDLRSPIDLNLFNTFRSYLYPDNFPVALQLHNDDRGSLFEAVKGHNGGQTFVSTTRPGITRGNHFHRRKVERFLVVQGEAIIRIRRLFSTEVKEFRVRGEQPVYIDMPTLHTHNISNVGDGELLTLFWAHEIFDPQTPDTVWEEV